MKTDVLFYRLFATLPEIFFQLTGRPADEAEIYRLESLEIKQTSYRLDGVFRPHLADPHRPIYFTEISARSDPRFYQGFIAKIFDYYDQKLDDRPFFAMAIFTERSLDPGVPVQYQIFLDYDVMQICYLEDLLERGPLPIELELLRLIVTPEAAAMEKAREVLDRIEVETEPGAHRREVVESIETVLVYKFPRVRREEIERMFELVDLRETAVYREAFEEGEKKGEKEGEKKGEKKGRLDAVPLLLESGVSVERIAESLELDLTAVRKVAARASRRTRSQSRS
jgi:predicted transposase/invertase (TIGR01784 family)